MNMRVAVCDDNPMIREQLMEMVCRIQENGKPEQNVCEGFEDGEQLLAAMQEGKKFDAVIMDIEWDGEERGIQVSGRIQELSPDTCIIYATGYTEKYVQQVFLRPGNLSGFMMKPVDEQILKENLRKVEEKRRQRDANRFIFQYKKLVQSIPYEDIVCVESSAHRLYTFTKQGEEFCCYGRLEGIMKGFPEYFIQCHKSYLVNMNEVRRMGDDHSFLMENGRVIPISRIRYNLVRETYFNYIRSSLFPVEDKTT